jgi:3-oxoadipate enol-lactonase
MRRVGPSRTRDAGGVATLERDDGVRVWYLVDGGETSPVLVLVGPAGTNSSVWADHVARLSRAFRAVRLDSRGAGRTEPGDRPFTLADIADDIAALLTALDVPRAHVLGVSMGGCVAIEFALRHPGRLDRLVLVSTPPGGRLAEQTHEERFARIAAARRLPAADRGLAMARLLFGPRAVAARSASYRELAETLGWDVDPRDEEAQHPQNTAIAAFDASDRLAGIVAPTLVIHGDDDRLVPSIEGERIAASIPNAELTVLPGGHLVYLQAAAAFDDTLVSFLDR